MVDHCDANCIRSIVLEKNAFHCPPYSVNYYCENIALKASHTLTNSDKITDLFISRRIESQHGLLYVSLRQAKCLTLAEWIGSTVTVLFNHRDIDFEWAKCIDLPGVFTQVL